MKFIILLIIALPFVSFSQLNVTEYFVGNTQEVVELHTLPYDENRLVEVYTLGPNPNLPIGNYMYEMSEITGGTIQPFLIPLCSNLTKPEFLENGILVGGEYLNGGQELIYWDGSNVTVFDLDSLADSNPWIHFVEDEVFVIATVEGNKRAYRFDEATLSIDLVAVNQQPIKRVIASFNGDYFYQCSFPGNPTPTEFLWGTDNALGSLEGSTQAGIFDIGLTGNYPSWKSPIVKNGKLYLLQAFENLNNTANCNFKVISIEPQLIQGYTTTVLFEEDQVLGTSSANMFEWNGDLYYYRGNTNELFKSTDWENFQLDATLLTGTFREHYISENGKLYFVKFLFPTDDNQIVEFTNGNFELRSGGGHLHIINEIDDKMYVSDWQWSDSSMIRVLDTEWNFLDTALIFPSSHSPVHNSSVMFQGKFTFLYATAIPYVLQLNGTVLSTNILSLIEDEVYPNPVESGGTLIIKSELNQECQLISTSGKVILSKNLFKGENHLTISELNPGIYFLNTGNTTHRIVVI